MLAHNTRAYYYEKLESISDWKKELAQINKERMGFMIEAPILDHTIAFAYQIFGGEHLWIPRVLSSLFWMFGGIFLYLIAKKLFTIGAALFSTGFYLFLPFGISASRSFQPDPLMVMLLLLSILLILKYHDKPSLLMLVTATAVSSMAMIIKPYCIFLIYGSFISTTWYWGGFRKLFTNRDLLIFMFISPLPGAVYYISGLLTEGAFLQEHASASFLPHLLLKPYFWKDWLAMILRVIGLISFTGALLGIFVIKKRPSRDLIIGLWIGYIIYGLLFTFHIHTHDYYQLPFIPVIALSLGPIGSMMASRLFSYKKRAAVSVAVLLIAVFSVVHIVRDTLREDSNNYSKTFGYVLGINPQFYRFIKENYERELILVQEIGGIVNHSRNTVFLTSDFGRFLTYHGELSGIPWPTTVSFQERKDRGIRVAKGEELFNGRYFTLRTHAKFIRYTPDFFIITDFKEFEKQPDLKEFLYANYPVIANNDDYIIFDLRGMSGKI
jgi:hypothetical protein